MLCFIYISLSNSNDKNDGPVSCILQAFDGRANLGTALKVSAHKIIQYTVICLEIVKRI